MKKYYTSLLKTYWHDWSVANGIRELAQNMLDSPAASEYYFSGDTMQFTSKNITIPPATLLMGETTKRGDDESVGGKGEGFKAAATICIREGYGFTIYNGNKKWTPAFEYLPDFDREVLVFTETEYSGSDLTFEVTGVNQEIIDQVIHDCLYLQEDLGEVLEGSTGRILKDIKGKLYVGGLFVKDIPSYEYSFDFKPAFLKLNRDRLSVEDWDLARNTSILIKELIDPVEIAKLVEQRKPDVQNLQHRSDLTAIAEACYDNLVEKYGDDVVICQWYDDQDKLEKQGYKNVVNVSHGNYYDILTQSPRYKEKFVEITEQLNIEPEDTRTPLELLEEWYNDICDVRLNKFEEILDTFRSRGVSFDS